MVREVDAAYIHIPFCKKICHYCAFNKYFYDGQPVPEYLQALEREYGLYLDQEDHRPFDTIYVGGGTPSCLNLEELDQLLQGIKTHLPHTKETEFSFEINPGELSLEKCHLLKDYGVNRISMGVQTFNDHLLRKIGRNHREHHIYQSIDWLRQAGFDNLSIDLIFRLPQQSLADFDQSLTKALSLELPHYSLYSLIIENNTVFQQLQRQGKLPLPSEDVDADMFELAIERLDQAGIKQYEVSNFARPGFESRHNLKYWSYLPYYGFGAGAHGFINQGRYHNFGPVHHYRRALDQGQKPLISEGKLSLEEQMEEYLFLALRTVRGMSIQDFHKRFGQDPLTLFATFLEQEAANGLLKLNQDSISLSKRGLFLADTVFRDLLGSLSTSY